jgi:hypothetical protein
MHEVYGCVAAAGRHSVSLLFGQGDSPSAAGSARDADRQVGIRLDPPAFGVLTALALREGVSRTTMARMLLRKALSDAMREASNGPLP